MEIFRASMVYTRPSVAVQMRQDLFLRPGGVDDDGAVFPFRSVRYVNGIQQRLVHDNDIIRVINIGMYPDEHWNLSGCRR